MFGLFGNSESEADICRDIRKKIVETEKAFNVARTIYDRFGLPDGDYYTAYEGFSNFVEMWSLGGSGAGNSKLQLKIIRGKLNLIHGARMLIASNLKKKFDDPDE